MLSAIEQNQHITQRSLSGELDIALGLANAYLKRLAPGGILAITRWLKLPPRDSLRLFATAIEALRRSGARDPGQRLMLLRGWNTTTLLIGNRAFSPADVDSLREFCRARSFDVAMWLVERLYGALGPAPEAELRGR